MRKTYTVIIIVMIFVAAVHFQYEYALSQSEKFPITAWNGPVNNPLGIETAGFNLIITVNGSNTEIDDAALVGIKSIVNIGAESWLNGQKLVDRLAYETDINSGVFVIKDQSHKSLYFDFDPPSYVGNEETAELILAYNGLVTRVLASEGAGTVMEVMNSGYHSYMQPRSAELDISSPPDGKITFNVKFSMKVDDNLQIETPVAKIYVKGDGVELAQLVINSDDFGGTAIYYDFDLSYSIPTGGGYYNKIEFGVYSYGNVSFNIDKITGSDEVYDHLEAGNFDTEIEDIYDDFTTPAREPYFLNWFLKDEPFLPLLMANKLVYDKLNDPGRTYPKKSIQNFSIVLPAGEAAGLSTPPVIMFDKYPFFIDADQTTINVNDNTGQTGGSRDYTTLQGNIYNFLEVTKAFYDTTVAKYTNVEEYWGFVQAHGFYNGSSRRVVKPLPKLEEIRLHTYLYLAYGAKGIAYFKYATTPDNLTLSQWNALLSCSSSSTCTETAYKIWGLVNREDAVGAPDDYDPHDPQWGEVQDLNSDLIKVGPVFRELTWIGAYTHYWDTPLSGGVVQGVSSAEFGDNSFIEVSEFSHPSGDKYFMLVNRRVQASETQTLTVTLETGAKRLIEDVLASREPWDENPNRVAYRILSDTETDFTVELKPGEGRLFRLSTAGLSGAVDEDRYWSGEVWVGGNYIISDGAKLEIYPGVTTKFSDNARLKVVGQLDAIGTSGNNIVFKSINSSPAAGDWYGIEIGHTSGSGRKSIIKYCDIKHAVSGVIARSVNDSLEIYNTAFSKCQIGIYAINSDLDIMSNSFNGGSGGQYGIYIQSATTKSLIYNNVIDNYRTTTGYGIYSNGSSPVIGYNEITHNLKDGLYSTGSGNPKVYKGYTNGGENTITNNSRSGVYATGGSLPFLGKLSFQQGKNCIKSNSSYEVANYNTYGMIYAAYNGWAFGSGPPPSEIYGWVLTVNPLCLTGCNVCLPTGILDNLYKNFASIFTIIPEPALALQTSFTEDLESAIDKMYERDFENALPILKRIVRDYPEAKESEYALSLITEALREVDGQSALEAYLESIVQNGNNTISERYSKRLLVREYQRGKNFTKSENLAKELLSLSPTAEEKKDMLFEIATLNLFGKNNHSEAAKYFRQIVSEFPDDDIAAVAQSHLDVFLNEGGLKKTPAVNINTPTSYSLSDNYPNPFNPVTQIDFSLPEEGYTRLIIYDLRGREAARLMDKELNAGYHSVKWDASRFASGIYFYTLQSGNFVQTKKMLMLK
ncbi:MAG: T9SS type A sorting domain-containing protein [Candidatus Marinimicrobia bacterium]|nr:T9SS type A sorting domain-containing protein [Candidatus Neomarinimicrobiota bacterium]